jgi:hypothetical protein
MPPTVRDIDLDQTDQLPGRCARPAIGAGVTVDSAVARCGVRPSRGRRMRVGRGRRRRDGMNLEKGILRREKWRHRGRREGPDLAKSLILLARSLRESNPCSAVNERS